MKEVLSADEGPKESSPGWGAHSAIPKSFLDPITLVPRDPFHPTLHSWPGQASALTCGLGHLDQASPEDALQPQLHVEVLGPTGHRNEEVGDIQAPVLGHELVDDTGGRVLRDPDILQGNGEPVRALCGRHNKRTLQGTRMPCKGQRGHLAGQRDQAGDRMGTLQGLVRTP